MLGAGGERGQAAEIREVAGLREQSAIRHAALLRPVGARHLSRRVFFSGTTAEGALSAVFVSAAGVRVGTGPGNVFSPSLLLLAAPAPPWASNSPRGRPRGFFCFPRRPSRRNRAGKLFFPVLAIAPPPRHTGGIEFHLGQSSAS